MMMYSYRDDKHWQAHDFFSQITLNDISMSGSGRGEKDSIIQIGPDTRISVIITTRATNVKAQSFHLNVCKNDTMAIYTTQNSRRHTAQYRRGPPWQIVTRLEVDCAHVWQVLPAF
jgi:hypothetical protein